MADWIRRSYTSPGLTQIPPGPHLGALQNRFGGGVVMLCIDVSGSMDGQPVLEAARGAQQFVAEAVEARYKVGVMLWNTRVVDMTDPDDDGKSAARLLGRTTSASGGNNLMPPLERCHKVLDRFSKESDRVVAIFGDGDISPRDLVLAKVAQMRAENIRFVTRGLGSVAAREFAEIATEPEPDVAVNGVESLAAGIAGMAASLRRGGLKA